MGTSAHALSNTVRLANHQPGILTRRRPCGLTGPMHWIAVAIGFLWGYSPNSSLPGFPEERLYWARITPGSSGEERSMLGSLAKDWRSLWGIFGGRPDRQGRSVQWQSRSGRLRNGHRQPPRAPVDAVIRGRPRSSSGSFRSRQGNTLRLGRSPYFFEGDGEWPGLGANSAETAGGSRSNGSERGAGHDGKLRMSEISQRDIEWHGRLRRGMSRGATVGASRSPDPDKDYR